MKSDLGLGDNAQINVSAGDAQTVRVDLHRFRQKIRQLLAAEPNEIEAATAAVRTLLAIPGSYAAAYFRRAESERLRPASPLICQHQYADQIRGHESKLVDAVDRMLQVQGPIAYPLSDTAFNIYVYPLGEPGNITGAVALFAEIKSDELDTNPLILAAGVVSAELCVHHLYSPDFTAAKAQARGSAPVASNPEQPAAAPSGADGERFQASLVSDIIQSNRDDTAQTICHRIANRTEQQTSASQIMLGIADRRARRCKLQAMSGMATFAKRSPLVTQAEELMSESVLHDDLFEARATSKPHELTSAEQAVLDFTDADRLIHGPLIDQAGAKVGAWIVVEHPDHETHAADGELVDRVIAVQPAVANAIGLVRRLKRDRLGLVWRKLALPEDDIVGRRRFWQIAALLGALLIAPFPSRVSCDAELFPVTYRFVPAPYEGILNEVLVEPGDVVHRGQVLARMDANELDWQLAANRAELMQASKQKDSKVASRDTSASQLARLEMERLQAETKMLEDRAKKLEITSPIDGIILGGESKKLEGARIRVGENLFETGPLERMVAEVYIADEEIARIKPQQAVQVRLDAFPFRTFRGTISSLSPRTETYEDANVFVAEVELDNVKNLLRPGMVGRGRISTGWRPLVWNLFQKPFEQLLRIVRW